MLNTKRTLFRLMSFALVLAFAGGAAPVLQTLAAPAAMPISNQLAAKLVLGQPDFTTNTPGTTQNKLHWPEGVTGDATSRLYVADRENNHILIFNNAAAKANGGNADNVLGQPNFTSNTANNGGLSARSLNTTCNVFYDAAADVLWVADWFNNRVLMLPDTPTSTFR